MKINILLIVLLSFLSVPFAFGQLYFSVNTDMQLSNAQIGYKVTENVVPYLGLQYYGGKISFNNEYEYFTSEGKVTDEVEGKVKGSVFMPTLGLKFYAMEKENLKAFANIAIAKPFLGANISSDDAPDEEIEEVNEVVDEFIDNLSLFSLEAGIGMEYFIADQFSIGAEFGLRYLKLGFSETLQYSDYNPNTGNYETVEDKVELSANVKPTFARFSLNFFF